jgi:hypothetical protein
LQQDGAARRRSHAGRFGKSARLLAKARQVISTNVSVGVELPCASRGAGACQLRGPLSLLCNGAQRSKAATPICLFIQSLLRDVRENLTGCRMMLPAGRTNASAVGPGVRTIAGHACRERQPAAGSRRIAAPVTLAFAGERDTRRWEYAGTIWPISSFCAANARFLWEWREGLDIALLPCGCFRGQREISRNADIVPGMCDSTRKQKIARLESAQTFTTTAKPLNKRATVPVPCLPQSLS